MNVKKGNLIAIHIEDVSQQLMRGKGYDLWQINYRSISYYNMKDVNINSSDEHFQIGDNFVTYLRLVFTHMHARARARSTTMLC